MIDHRLLIQKMKSVIFCHLYVKKNRGLNWANFVFETTLVKVNVQARRATRASGYISSGLIVSAKPQLSSASLVEI